MRLDFMVLYKSFQWYKKTTPPLIKFTLIMYVLTLVLRQRITAEKLFSQSHINYKMNSMIILTVNLILKKQ